MGASRFLAFSLAFLATREVPESGHPFLVLPPTQKAFLLHGLCKRPSTKRLPAMSPLHSVLNSAPCTNVWQHKGVRNRFAAALGHPAAIALLFAAAVMATNARPSGGQALATPHPLDGLTSAEIRRVTEILRHAGEADDQTRYPLIELLEPPKATVLAWTEEDPGPRRALVHLRGRSGFRTAVIDFERGAVVAAGPAEGQPMVLFEEFTSAMNAALEHPGMVAGLARRGLTPDDVFCLPLTAGNYPTPEFDGTRLMKVPCYLNPSSSNYYAKPIEGLLAVVDLSKNRAINVVDEAVVPVPEDDWGYAQDEVAARVPLRPRSSPVTLAQPGGAGYIIEGSRVEWDIWRFRLRVGKREGVVLSTVDVRDGERWRSVLYQAHLSEVFVPYMDPAQSWYFRTFMDSGEYGLGLFLSPLEAGLDCPDHATFLPAVVSDDRGRPLTISNAICIFERYIGDPAWRHFEVFAQSDDRFVPAEGRPDTELVVRTASVIGNYDYLIDYRFRQNGDIHIAIGATGLDAVKGVASTTMQDSSATDTAHGTLVAPNLVAPFHDHYFNFRLDFDIDGPLNHPAVLEIVPDEPPPDNPRRSFWTVRRSHPASELKARYRLSAVAPRYFLVANEAEHTPLGHHPAYMIHHGNVAYGPFDYEVDPPMKRNAYIEYTIWNTVYDPARRYAGGDFAMQSDGSDTLAEWVKADRPLQGADVVTWFTTGFHHITRTEDWPVMSTDWKTIHIRPHNFFSLNPALTIRPRTPQIR